MPLPRPIPGFSSRLGFYIQLDIVAEASLQSRLRNLVSVTHAVSCLLEYWGFWGGGAMTRQGCLLTLVACGTEHRDQSCHDFCASEKVCLCTCKVLVLGRVVPEQGYLCTYREGESA